MFIGREKELADLNAMYFDDRFQLFILYGRRRVRKTTLLNEFCKEKPAIFYSAEQSTSKLKNPVWRERNFTILFISIGSWWGTDPVSHSQVEIDLVS